MSEHEDQVETPTQEKHIIDCIKPLMIIGPNINKWEVVTQISVASGQPRATASTDNEQRANTRGTYLAILDEHDWMLTNASSCGYQGSTKLMAKTVDKRRLCGEDIGLQAGVQSVLSAQLSAQLAMGCHPAVLPLDYYRISAMCSCSRLVKYLFIFNMFSAPQCGLLTYSLYLEFFFFFFFFFFSLPQTLSLIHATTELDYFLAAHIF